jgi:hypothetical protein
MRRVAGLLGAFLAVGIAACPTAVQADLFSSLSYGVRASTIGDGITLEKPLLYDFSVRVTTGALSITNQSSYDGTPYTTTTRYNNFGVIGDFRPYGGRYRISGGLVFGNDRIDNIARPQSALIQVGNGLYSSAGAGQVLARVSFNRPSIYAGVGTGTGIVRGLALDIDGGILLRNGVSSATASGPLNTNPAFRADLNRLQGELRTHIVVPVVSIGLVYRP